MSDRNVDDPKSRTHSLIKFISYLIQKDCLPYPFVLADICGGDAIVASKLKEHFSFSEIIAQDCFKDKFETHKRAGEVGVKLYGGYLQHIVEENLKFSKLDIVMMLNTFRGWESAQLRAHEQNLPAQTLEWFERNSRYIIVTATKEQIDFLKNSGRNVEVFAHGEDNSYFICIY